MLLSTNTSSVFRFFGHVDGIRVLAEAGFDALDLSLFHLSDPAAIELSDRWRERADAQLEMCRTYRISFRQAHAPFGGGYDHYTGVLLPRMPRAFEVAAYMGVRDIIVHPLQRGRYYGHEDELFEMNMKFYRDLLPLAKEYGLRIAVENMWQCDPHTGVICDDVCANPAELAKYVDTLDDEHFTVCLDIGHVGLCGREPEDAIRLLGNRIGALHVHDVNYKDDLHTLPGCGKYNWEPICDALRDVGYAGDFTYEAENFTNGYPKELVPDAAAFMVKVGRYLISRIERKD